MSLTKLQWSTATIAALTASLLVAYHTAPRFYSAKFEHCSRPGHKDSFARILPHLDINGALQETYSTTIPLRMLKKNIRDDEILARFNRGFFSGPAFTIERWLLCGPRVSFLSTEAIEAALNNSTKSSTTGFRLGSSCWNRDLRRLSSTSVPPVASLFFGNFLVLDTNNHSDEELGAMLLGSPTHYSPPEHPFIEWAFRGDSVAVAASHRFEVKRRREATSPGHWEEVVEITFSHVSCSPTTGGPIMGGWITSFHVLYSKYLFSDGIRSVLEQ